LSAEASLKELKKISKILLLANAAVIETELSKIATTTDRKKIWVLMDGNRMPADIAQEAKVTAMTVSNFVNAGKAAELIEYKKGEPPKRILDYVPPSWIELMKTVVIEETKEEPQQKLEPKLVEERKSGES
jgi:hypothetical protein